MFWICLLVLVVAVALYIRQIYTKFSRYGVKNEKPVPLLGNMSPILLQREHFVENLERLYNLYRNERFIGKYEFVNGTISVHDLDLVKKITVKDFEHFVDRRAFISEDIDPLLGNNLSVLQGQKWKDMRSTLSPAFTSAKIRRMVPFIVEVGDQMEKVLKQKIQDSKDGAIDVDVRDLTTRYATDVIASCAFGLQVDSQTDQENQFYKIGKEITVFGLKQLITVFAYLIMPKLVKKIGLSMLPDHVNRFFRNLVKNTMQDREARDIVRPDMIHLLMEAKKGRLSHDDKPDTDAGYATVEETDLGKRKVNRVWSDDDLTAQTVVFLVAGFETISTTMSFLLSEVAVNPDVQEKLYQEILETDAKNGGKFDYSSIQQMPYLDMVVSETLRLWSPGAVLDRQCIKDYNLGTPNDRATEDYIIRKGEGLQIPVWGFHHDPQYFPNPHKFDPERFSEDNKKNIRPFSYMPFGVGPRNCIGARFALCEVKVMAYHLLKSMELSPCTKTQIPAKLSREVANIVMHGGHWVRFKAKG